MKPKKVYQHISPLKVLQFLEEGYTLQEIGDHYGVTKQRISQIRNSTRKQSDKGWDIKAWRERRKERNRIVEAD